MTMFIAAGGWPGGWLLLWIGIGGYMAAGAANAINMVIDRDIDGRMLRTSKRPTVTQSISSRNALLFGLVTKAKEPKAYDFVGKYVSVEPYAIMYRKDDPAFTKLMDVALSSLFSTGQIRSIYAKWFESGVFKLAMNVYMKENIELPNRYGVP